MKDNLLLVLFAIISLVFVLQVGLCVYMYETFYSTNKRIEFLETFSKQFITIVQSEDADAADGKLDKVDKDEN